jgi:hypothetical protein
VKFPIFNRPKYSHLFKAYNNPTYASVKYDICATAEITAAKGIIVSPGYPNYQTVTQVCRTKIIVPAGKTLNIYSSDIALKARNSDGK